jgi:signal peptidase I
MQVSGDSMSPSFKNNNIIFLKKVNSKTKISRGDVVVINHVFEKKLKLLKRVIGLPNETIKIDDKGEIFVNNRVLKELYIDNQGKTNFFWELGEREFIVLGDNRNNTFDSREFGKITVSNIFWKTFFSLKPLKKIKNPKYFQK